MMIPLLRRPVLPWLLVACLGPLASCGESNSENGQGNGEPSGNQGSAGQKAASALVGHWRVVDMTPAKVAMVAKAMANSPDTPRSEIESMFADDSLSYSFKADGTSESHDELGNRGHEHVQGTWTIDGARVTLTENDKPVMGTLAEGKLTIAVLRFDGTPLPLVLERSDDAPHGDGH